MPKRTNTFQEVVAVVQKHMAPDAVIEESAMVTPTSGGAPREVDVLVTSAVGQHAVVVAVEASARGRRASVEWVEQVLKKHEDLPTNKLVLYSSSGFTKAAHAKALANNAAPISGEPIADQDLERSVLAGLRTASPNCMHVAPVLALVSVERADGSVGSFVPSPDVPVIRPDGLGMTFIEVVLSKFDEEIVQVVEFLDVDGLARERDVTITWKDGEFTAVVDGENVPLFIEGHRIVGVEFTVRVTFNTQSVDLTHTRLGDVHVAYGELAHGDEQGLLVATDASGSDRVTFRVAGRDMRSRSYQEFWRGDSTEGPAGGSAFAEVAEEPPAGSEE